MDHPQYLLRLAELELIDRHQRMVERRIRAARFPAERGLAVAGACHSGGDAPHLPAHHGQHPLHGGRAVGSGFELPSPVLRSCETVARSVVVGTSVKPHAFYSPRFSRVLSGPGGCWEGRNHACKTHAGVGSMNECGPGLIVPAFGCLLFQRVLRAHTFILP